MNHQSQAWSWTGRQGTCISSERSFQNADGISATSVVMASPACLSCRWEGQDLEFELLAVPPPPEQDGREAMQLLQ